LSHPSGISGSEGGSFGITNLKKVTLYWVWRMPCISGVMLILKGWCVTITVEAEEESNSALPLKTSPKRGRGMKT
jgi:hypothetical protein